MCLRGKRSLLVDPVCEFSGQEDGGESRQRARCLDRARGTRCRPPWSPPRSRSTSIRSALVHTLARQQGRQCIINQTVPRYKERLQVHEAPPRDSGLMLRMVAPLWIWAENLHMGQVIGCRLSSRDLSAVASDHAGCWGRRSGTIHKRSVSHQVYFDGEP